VSPSTTRTSTATSRWRAAELALLALVVGVLWQGPSGPSEVVLIGDSIVQETTPYLRPLLGTMEVSTRYYGGTAPCDWLEADLAVTSRSVVVVSFIGNSLTPCMADDAGGHLRGSALVERYDADLTSMVERLRAIGARVVLVGQPRRATGATSDLEVAGINRVYTELAALDGVSFVDAGAMVEAADGTFASTLPCLATETECGPGGRIAVRNDDGLHLCPGTAQAPCPVYSSGAFRFASAIATAVKSL
jgi:hypothetical protein